MKKIYKIALVLTLLFGAYNTQAQDIDFGIKAGMNYASISDTEADPDNRLGFTGGIFVGARFNALSVTAEALFSQQGAEFDSEKVDLDYALVPIIAKIHFLRIFNIQAGPQFSFLVNESDVVESEKLDVSGAVGLGLNLPSGLRVDARYNVGFTDTFKGAEGKNRFYSIALGYSFL